MTTSEKMLWEGMTCKTELMRSVVLGVFAGWMSALEFVNDLRDSSL